MFSPMWSLMCTLSATAGDTPAALTQHVMVDAPPVAPGGPFSGFGQTVTAVGAAGSTTGGPLSGSCTLGASQVVVTMTCSEDQGGTPVSRTFDLTCPAGTVAAAPSVPVPAFGNPARILLALSALLMGMVTLALRARRG